MASITHLLLSYISFCGEIRIQRHNKCWISPKILDIRYLKDATIYLIWILFHKGVHYVHSTLKLINFLNDL